MKTTFIYAICEPNMGEIRYVGKSNNPKSRFSHHISKAKNKSVPHVCAWIRGILKRKLRPEYFIIDEIERSEWKFWEQHYISLFKSWGINLTNLKEGGDNDFSNCERKEIAKKISKSILQYSRNGIFIREWESLSEATRFYNLSFSVIWNVLNKRRPTAKNSLWRYKNSDKYPLKIRGVPIDREKMKNVIDGHKKVALFMTGRKLKKSSIEKIRKAKTGVPSARRRKIFQYDLSGKFIKEWEYIQLASNTLNIKQANICKCANKQRNLAGGFIWSYKPRKKKEQEVRAEIKTY